MTKAIAMLRSIAGLKRYDPNGIRGFKRSTITVNVPLKLLESIDEFLAAQPSQAPAADARDSILEEVARMFEDIRSSESLAPGYAAQKVRQMQQSILLDSPGLEPRNVEGMTRAEFEKDIRYRHDYSNVLARERGHAPMTQTQIDEDVRKRVERNYPSSAYDYSPRGASPLDHDCNCDAAYVARAEVSEQQLENFDVAIKNLAVKHARGRTTAGGWVFENHELFKFAHAIGQKYPNDNTTEQEPRLDKRAQVGNTRFGVGIKWSTVIGAAQRHFEFMQTPEKEAARIAKASQVVEWIRNGRIAELEDRAAENNDMLKALAECRDAFPIPDSGSPLEGYWASAIGDPLEVPGYIRESLKQMREANHERPQGLRGAVFLVLSEFTLPLDVRKILETAYYG